MQVAPAGGNITIQTPDSAPPKQALNVENAFMLPAVWTLNSAIEFASSNTNADALTVADLAAQVRSAGVYAQRGLGRYFSVETFPEPVVSGAAQAMQSLGHISSHLFAQSQTMNEVGTDTQDLSVYVAGLTQARDAFSVIDHTTTRP